MEYAKLNAVGVGPDSPSQEVFIVNEDSKSVLYCWMRPDKYEFLRSDDGGKALQEWVEGLQVLGDIAEEGFDCDDEILWIKNLSHASGTRSEVSEDRHMLL